MPQATKRSSASATSRPVSGTASGGATKMGGATQKGGATTKNTPMPKGK